jgi:hypothetical protein
MAHEMLVTDHALTLFPFTEERNMADDLMPWEDSWTDLGGEG